MAISADAERARAPRFLAGKPSGLQAPRRPLIAGPLGELTGSMESSTDGPTWKLRLTFD